MIEVYGIPNCNTVKKAIEWLKEKSLPYRFHDYKKEGIREEKLKEWCGYFGWENLINKAGTTYKKLSDDEKAAIVDEHAAIQIMMSNTSIIRRPIVQAGKKNLIRFDEKEYANALLKK